MRAIIRTLAVVALLGIPAAALAAPDQNSNPNQNQNGCYNGRWVNGQCVYNNNGNNGNNGNGQWNNRNRNRDRDQNDRDDNNNRNRGGYNNGGYNNGGYNNGGYNNGGYNNGGYNNGGYNNGNRSGTLNATVSSFSPYNLYLSNGTHVELHNGTVISPTGTNLVAGQRVRVIGTWNGDGTFNANEIDVVGNGRNRGY